MLLREGADPNNRDANGYSCLFWAMRRRSKEISALLVAYGAEFTADGVKHVEAQEEDYASYEFARQEYERIQGRESAARGDIGDENSL